MKTKIFILLLLCSVSASAQWSAVNSYGTKYKRLRADSALSVPLDTFFITMSDRNLPHIAIKDSILYLWSVSQQQWRASGGGSVGGGGLTYTFNGPLSAIGSQVYLNSVPASIITGTKDASFITGTKDASFITGTKPYTFINDFDLSLRAQLSSGLGVHYDSTTGVISLQGQDYLPLDFGEGLEYLTSSGVVRARYFTPMWNANRLQGYPISASQPQNGDALIYNDTTATMVWRPAATGVTIAGGTQNHYQYEFTGTSTGSFTTPKPAISGSIEVFINGVKIPPSCMTVTVNTILVNQSCIGYPIATTDLVQVKIASTQ